MPDANTEDSGERLWGQIQNPLDRETEMYCTKNFKTKKELKEAVARGDRVTLFAPGLGEPKRVCMRATRSTAAQVVCQGCDATWGCRQGCLDSRFGDSESGPMVETRCFMFKEISAICLIFVLGLSLGLYLFHGTYKRCAKCNHQLSCENGYYWCFGCGDANPVSSGN